MERKERKILEDAGALFPSVVTNADRIRAMTNEELALWLTTNSVDRSKAAYDSYLAWLQQEASE